MFFFTCIFVQAFVQFGILTTTTTTITTFFKTAHFQASILFNFNKTKRISKRNIVDVEISVCGVYWKRHESERVRKSGTATKGRRKWNREENEKQTTQIENCCCNSHVIYQGSDFYANKPNGFHGLAIFLFHRFSPLFFLLLHTHTRIYSLVCSHTTRAVLKQV